MAVDPTVDGAHVAERKAVEVPLGAVTLAIASMQGECVLPTMNLRQVVPPVGSPYLQQRWVDPMTGSFEWRNLPVLNGNYPDRCKF